MTPHTLSFEHIPGMSEFSKYNQVLTLERDIVVRDQRAQSLGPKSAEVIQQTMSDVNYSSLQKSHLKALSSGKASVIVTGQQPGFLGGPLYSLYKAMTCIAIAKSQSTQDHHVVPVFWIEDNDHDGMEAGIATIIDAKGTLHSIECEDKQELQSKLSISERVFSKDISRIINEIVSLIPDTEFGHSIAKELQSIYQPGKSWSSAFLSFMQNRCGEFGVLFFSSSIARKSGVFSDVMIDELMNPGNLKTYVDRANNDILKEGRQLQSEAGDINAFYHDANGHRIKVECFADDMFRIGSQSFGKDELQQFFNAHCNQFSPSVLLRPLVQDAVLPTIGMIVGPGEARYMSQLCYAYPAYSIPMPMLYTRHSATILSGSIGKYLAKFGLTTLDFFKTINEIEQDLSLRFAQDASGDELFEALSKQIHDSIQSIAKHANTIDQSLQGAVSATEHGIEKQLDQLNKKIKSGIKKKQDQLFVKAQEVHDWVYSHNHLQERVLSAFSIEVKIGSEGLRRILSEIQESTCDEHLIFLPD